MNQINKDSPVGFSVGGHWPFPMTPGDGSLFDVESSGHLLRKFLSGPTTKEIADMRKGQARFALWEEGGVIFFLYKFGDQPWCDSPFSIHAYPQSRQYVPTYQQGTRALLTVLLVDSTSATLEGIRAITLRERTTEALCRMIAKQAQNPMSPAHYHRLAADIQSRVPTNKMVKDALINERGGT